MRWVLTAVVALFVAVAMFYAAIGRFDRSQAHFFATARPAPSLAALFLSGDMGLRVGKGPVVIAALVRRGIPVLGISSINALGTHRTRAEIADLVATGVRQALDRSGAQRAIVVGQSFGSDIAQTGLADLPTVLRAKIAGVILVVPGRSVFFRADPSALAYLGTPDSDGAATARRIDWAPVTCIYGDRETDSLCPSLHQPNVRSIPLPGGHFLRNDDKALVHAILTAVDAAPR